MAAWPSKDPDAKLDYTVKWSLWLRAGETIETSEWIIVGSVTPWTTRPGGYEFIDGGFTTVWLQGGTLSELCQITNRVTTSQGRTEDKTTNLRIRKK